MIKSLQYIDRLLKNHLRVQAYVFHMFGFLKEIKEEKNLKRMIWPNYKHTIVYLDNQIIFYKGSRGQLLRNATMTDRFLLILSGLFLYNPWK